jgi:tyrosine-protein kinase Etk/Wzc
VQNQSLLNQTCDRFGISQLRIQQADLASRFTPQHPTYKALLRRSASSRIAEGPVPGPIAELPKRSRACSA